MSSVEQDEKGLWCQNLSESVKVYCKNGTERKQVYLWAENTDGHINDLKRKIDYYFPVGTG